MSLGKLPGMKGLVSGSQAKRRFKNDLSVDMISPPLGDFRHTMHVGRGGDVFGDTSFLSNHGGAGGSAADAQSSGSKTAQFFSRTLRHVRRAAPVRPRGGSRDLSSPPPPVSPIIKNAISLPQLNLDNGCLRRALFPASPSCPESSTFSAYGLQSGFVTLPRLSRADRQAQDYSGTSDFRRSSVSDDCDYSVSRSDSMTSFIVDLGPSLMSEVFGVIDSPDRVHAANHSGEEEELEEASSTPEPPADAPPDNSPSASPRRRSGNSRRSSGAEEEGDGDEPLKMAADDEVVYSLCREDPGMEPERFKMAANVLARHYSTGGRSQEQEQNGDDEGPHAGTANNSSVRFQKGAPYAYPDDEDEIKV